ncbi:23S rRNA (guanosine(2251)-2'-O)-methyltransferase RlmB [Lichenicola sp.]|uniref:23S rRNA (guanosine(2251)-2'-O)-methyltransferase RlmB n=1 Tax=Lichenicola sp. TaxID=2804529 RepID=UPI003AFFF593
MRSRTPDRPAKPPAPHSTRPGPARGDATRNERPRGERPEAGQGKPDRPPAARSAPTLRAPSQQARLEHKRPENAGTEATPEPSRGGQRRGQHRNLGGAQPAGAANWLYGTHPVIAALANPQRRLRRLLLTDEAEAGLAARLGGPLPLAAERTDRSRLDALLGRDAVHQGMALLADPLATPTLDQVLQRPGLILVLDQITDPRNVGAILRSAAAFGVAAVILQDRNAPEETGTLAKAASGALEVVPVLRAVNLSRTLVALKAAGLWTVGLDAGGSRLDGASFKDRRVALVLGAEGEGLRRLTRETCDEIAGLVMPGTMESLNVSNAAAVALYEMVRTPG